MRKKRDYHHGDLRKALLGGVARVIREKGLGEVSLREVARRIGVSHGAPAHHFASKRALLTAFATEGYTKLVAACREEVARSHAEDPRERLASMGRGYFRFCIEQREYYEVMFRVDLTDTKDTAFKSATDALWSDMSAAVMEIGAKNYAPGKDLQAFGLAAWALAHGMAALWQSGRLGLRSKGADPMALIARATHVFVSGVAGWPEAERPTKRKRRPT
jgi:AcrR family transcriptional regulator